MSVYARYKRDPIGFRNLVELLETTPVARRQKMIDVGMAEDPVYTQQALQYMLSFEDVLNLSDLELAEVVAAAPPRMTAYAVSRASEEIQSRFIRNAPFSLMGEIRDCVQVRVSLREVGGAQLRLVSITRQLEKQGLIQTKRIPLGAGQEE